jgi:hypothetical protein
MNTQVFIQYVIPVPGILSLLSSLFRYPHSVIIASHENNRLSLFYMLTRFDLMNASRFGGKGERLSEAMLASDMSGGKTLLCLLVIHMDCYHGFSSTALNKSKPMAL